MAITATHYELLKSLPIPRGSTLLEIGEANWYGDVDPAVILNGREEHDCLTVELLDRARRTGNLFTVAKAFYWRHFAPGKHVAIDCHGTPSSLRLDLNSAIDLGEQFDVVINHGTAEHIFNIGQVFKTIHDHCELGGWMIHDAPFVGWVDHGFYCLQPTLFYDLAMANCYEVAMVAIHETKSRQIIRVESRDQIGELAQAGSIPNNSMLFMVTIYMTQKGF